QPPPRMPPPSSRLYRRCGDIRLGNLQSGQTHQRYLAPCMDRSGSPGCLSSHGGQLQSCDAFEKIPTTVEVANFALSLIASASASHSAGLSTSTKMYLLTAVPPQSTAWCLGACTVPS